MGRAKEIIVKVIPAKIANKFVKKHHYSGKYATSSLLHFGCFLDEKLHGVMSFGNPIDRRKLLSLVHTEKNKPVQWTEFLELNRMAFDDYLPKNSESRCFSVAIRMIKKNAPHIKWIISFSDGTQCGDGAIYRASGFYLTAIRESKNDLWKTPKHLGWDEEVAHRISIQGGNRGRIGEFVLQRYGTRNVNIPKLIADNGGTALTGFQLRYIYLIDKTCKITVPIIPFSKIDELGAGMYKGEKITLAERQQQALQALKDDATGNPAGEGVRYDRSAHNLIYE
ncbi:MAG: hypothetical protein ACR2K1_00155 [Saprospiraceae bacterium]